MQKNDVRNVPKFEAWRVATCIKRHSKGGLDLLTVSASEVLGSLGRHLVDLGCHFGAHWILKESPKLGFLTKSTYNEKSKVQEWGFENEIA